MPIPIGAFDPTLPDPEPIPISTTTPDSGGSSGGNDYDIPNTKTYLELEAANAAKLAEEKALADKAQKEKLTAEKKTKKIKWDKQRQAEEIAALSSQFGFVPPGVGAEPEQANFSRNLPQAPGGGIPTILGRMDDEKAPEDAWEGLLQALLEQKRRSVM